MNAQRHSMWPYTTQASAGIALLRQWRVIDVYKDGPELAT